MSEPTFGSELLKQSIGNSGAGGPSLPPQDRAELWRRIERSRDRAQKLKRWAIYAGVVLAGSILTIILATNVGDPNAGAGRIFRYVGGAGAFLGVYGGTLAVAMLVFNVITARALEVSGRLANMENLLEGMVIQMQQLSRGADNAAR